LGQFGLSLLYAQLSFALGWNPEPPAKAWILGDPTIPGVAKPASCEGLAAVFLWAVPSALSK